MKRNVHKRTKEEIQKISRNWERTPSQFVKLDIRTLLQDEAVQEVRKTHSHWYHCSWKTTKSLCDQLTCTYEEEDKLSEVEEIKINI